MAFGAKARVEVTATVSGTGAVGTMVANTSRIDFSFLSDGDYTYGYIEQGSLWEECTLTKSGSTLVRSSVISSSSGTSSVSFNGSSSSTVFVDIPISKLLIAQADGTFANADALLGTVALSTLTALKNAALPGSSGYARYVRGLATATDGTGGWYYWDSADATAGDDYLYVVSNVSGTGRWIRVKQQLDPATAASTGAVKTGAVARVSGNLISKHATYGALSVPESYNFVKAIFDTYAAFKAVASTTWGNGDRIGFNGISEKNDAPYHEGAWVAASTNTDALDILFIRPTDISGSNPGRVQFTEPAAVTAFADGDATPAVNTKRNWRASNAGTTLTALDDAIDLQTYTIWPSTTNNTTFTHSSSFVMPGNRDFTLKTAANGGAPVQIRFDNGIGYLMGGSGGGLSADVTISPSQITADQNDYAPTSHATANIMRVSTDAFRSLTGLAGGVAGRIVILENIGSYPLRLRSENSSSTAANRFAFSSDKYLNPGDGLVLAYDTTSSRWRRISGSNRIAEVHGEDFGMVGDGATDNKAAFDAAIAFCGTVSVPRLRIGQGTYYFNSKPADITVGVRIVGHSMSLTTLMRNYSAGSTAEGFIVFIDAGSMGAGIEELQIRANTSTTSGSMLKITCSAAVVCGYHYVNNVVITGTGSYERCMFVDGVLNTTGGSQGLRDVRVTNCYFFKGASGSTETIRIINGVNHHWTSVWTNGVITVTGGGSGTTNSVLINFSNLACLDQLFVSESSYVKAEGYVNTLNFSTNSSNCYFNGIIAVTSGGYANTGTDNCIISPNYGIIGGRRPAFSAHKNGTAQTGVASATFTKVTFGTEIFDVGGYFASSTFTPPAGYARFSWCVRGATVLTYLSAHLYKNGARFADGNLGVPVGGAAMSVGSIVDVCNGSDTYEIYVIGDASTTFDIAGASYQTYFSGEHM